jgi:hypothetical protein
MADAVSPEREDLLDLVATVAGALARRVKQAR